MVFAVAMILFDDKRSEKFDALARAVMDDCTRDYIRPLAWLAADGELLRVLARA